MNRRIAAILAQFGAGALFGVGLLVSGMANPAKVLNFLDLSAIYAGTWDGSLAFVMIAAVAVAFIGFRLARRRPRPLLAAQFPAQPSPVVDARLLVGACLFGLGWGLAGYCPGPALVGLGAGSPKAALFVLAMLAGMAAARWLSLRIDLRRAAPR